MIKCCFRLLLPTFVGMFLLAGQADGFDGLDEWLEAERERWSIPGMAVAVVHEDAIVYARGFGRLRLDGDREVDADTVFGIASLSKAMTATALGMLVDEGHLDWDDRIVDHLPEFRLSDDWVTGQVTVRDLLGHRVGVGRLFGNRLTFMPRATRHEFMSRLRHHEFEQPFRQGYVYSNAMYTVAGELLERLSGQRWEEFLLDRLFEPLSMSRSGTSIDQLDDNAAWPHQEIRGEIVEIERRNWGYAGPAAAVNSSMNDMAQWMRFNLGEAGEVGGKRLVSAEVMGNIHSPVNLIGFEEEENAITAYALGWGVSRYGGLHILRHGGATDGFNTQIWLIPELNLGIVMSANLFTQLRDPVMRRIVDLATGREPVEWGERKFAEFAEEREKARQARKEKHLDRRDNTQPSHPLAAYTGQYHDPLYDTAEVFSSDGRLTIRFWNDEYEELDLEHWHFNTFRGHWRNPARREKFIWFTMNEYGQPAILHVRFTLRPEVLEEGVYPADYFREIRFIKQ